jgi:hypothetical protein
VEIFDYFVADDLEVRIWAIITGFRSGREASQLSFL